MNVLNGTNTACPKCEAQPGHMHTSDCPIPKYGATATTIPVNVHVTSIEVRGDDPDRFALGMLEHLDAKERALDLHGYGGGMTVNPSEIRGLNPEELFRGDETAESMRLANEKRDEWNAISAAVGPRTDRKTLLQAVRDIINERASLRSSHVNITRLQSQITEVARQRDDAEVRNRVTQERLESFMGAIADQAVALMNLRAEHLRTQDDAARTRAELIAAVEHAERLISERNSEREIRKTHEARVAHLDRLIDDQLATIQKLQDQHSKAIASRDLAEHDVVQLGRALTAAHGSNGDAVNALNAELERLREVITKSNAAARNAIEERDRDVEHLQRQNTARVLLVDAARKLVSIRAMDSNQPAFERTSSEIAAFLDLADADKAYEASLAQAANATEDPAADLPF